MVRPIADRLNLFVQEKSANELEQLRQSMQNTLRAGVRDGQLIAIIAAMTEKKKAQELSEMRQSLKQAFQSSLHDGRLTEVMATLKQEKGKSSLVETMRLSVKSSIQSALFDGRLSDIIARVNHEKKARQMEQILESARDKAKHIFLQTASDGRLEAALQTTRQTQVSTETLRIQLKSTLHVALDDGRLMNILASLRGKKEVQESRLTHTPMDIVILESNAMILKAQKALAKATPGLGNKEEEAKAMESLRLSARSTLQEAVCDGRLAKAIAIVKQEKEAETLENLRQNLQQTFTAAVLEGRLSEVITTVREAKKAKEAEHLRQTMKELNEMRQSVKQTFQSSLNDGRLSKVIATLRADRDAQELEDMRQGLQHTLQASLLDGRLSAVIASVAEKRRAKEIEAMRQNMQSTLRTSLLNGRLSEVISHVVDERKDAKVFVAEFEAISSAPVNALPISGPAPTPTPAKPTSAKTTSRPIRRHASRNVDSVDKQAVISSGAESLSMSAPLPPLKALPPRPPTPSSRLKGESSRKASDVSAAPTPDVREASLAHSFDMLHRRAPSPRAVLPKLSRPASSDCMLPPVTPPSRRPAATLAARPSCRVPSAMSLDLGTACGVPSTPTISLGLDQDLLGGRVQQTSHSRSLSQLRESKMTLKQGPSFLPPIVGMKASEGCEGKSTTHKRSASVDSFMWGVAPLVNSHTEWDVVGRLIV